MDNSFIVRLPDSHSEGETQVRYHLVVYMLNRSLTEYFQSFFILESRWETDSVALSLVNETGQFTGTINYDHFKDISSSLEIEHEIFFNETKSAITTNNGVEEFIYLMINDAFVWKKRNKRLEIIYGKANLDKNQNLHLDILTDSVEMIANLKKELIEKNIIEQDATEQNNENFKLLKSAIENEQGTEVYMRFLNRVNKTTNINKFVKQSPILILSDDSLQSTPPRPVPRLPKRKKFVPPPQTKWNKATQTGLI